MSIYSRGRPDGLTKMNPHERVHLMAEVQISETITEDDALCRTGRYNTHFTREPEEVTCEACLEKMNS